jgi:DNA-binding winged helix-turn-helix (wHTH) protein
MVLEVPGSSIIDWVAELVDTQSRGGTTDGELSFVRDRREIMVDGDVVELTPLEAQVLARLIDRAPAVVGREEFIEHIWQRTYVGSNVVDTVVRTLRKKLGSLRGRVQTVPKTGYRYLAEAGSDGKLSGL